MSLCLPAYMTHHHTAACTHVNQTLTSSLGSTPDFQNKSPKLLQNKSPYFLRQTLKTFKMDIFLTFNGLEAMTGPTQWARVQGPDQRCL